MGCFLAVSHGGTAKEPSQDGLEAHFAEVYLFQFAGFLQMAKAGG